MIPVSPVLPSVKVSHYVEDVVAANQPQYTPLPVILGREPSGMVTSRWSLTWKERLKALFVGNIFVQVLTYRNPLQPMKLFVDEPTLEECL